MDEVGIVPDEPVPYGGWGDLPDQYGRRRDGDDGESTELKRPARLLADLSPIRPWRGPRQRGRYSPPAATEQGPAYVPRAYPGTPTRTPAQRPQGVNYPALRLTRACRVCQVR